MSNRDGKRMVVYGMSGSGKTFLVKQQFLNACDRMVIFDPEEEFAKEKGFETVHNLQGLLNILSDCWDSSFRIAYVPRVSNEEAELHEVSCLIERLQEPYKEGKHEHKIMLIVDELNLSFPLNPKPGFDGFARLVSRGRKRGVSIIGITQRPAEVGPRLRGNVDRVIAFRFSLANDIEAIKKSIGSDVGDALRELKQYSYIYAENGDWKIVAPS